MKKILSLIAFATFAFFSCSKDEPVVAVGDPIEFTTTIDWGSNTRTMLTETYNMTSFTLNAMTWSKNTSGAGAFDFMDYFTVTKRINTQQYYYHPVKYYPSEVGNGVSFFAYSPAGSLNVSFIQAIPNATLGGVTSSLTYNVPTKYVKGGANAEDFLVSTVKQTTGAVNMDFTHALAAISFKGTNKSASNKFFVVHKIELLYLDNSAVLTFTPHATAGSTAGSYVWSSNTTAAEKGSTYVLSLPEGGVMLYPPNLSTGAVATTYSLTSDGEYMMMLPQAVRPGGVGSAIDTEPTDMKKTNSQADMNNGDALKTYIAVTFSAFQNNTTLLYDKAVKYLPVPDGSITKFEQNKTYEFVITFDDTVIPFISVP